MTRAVRDFYLGVQSGRYPEYSGVIKFGRNDSIALNSTEDIWDGSGLYSFPTTALITSMSQTVNQAALTDGTIEVQGLDANWDFTTQEVDLDGANTTTAVTLPTPLIRVFRMKVLENVATDSPVRVHNVGETVDYAIISPGNNQTLMAIYTVPNGKTAYVTHWYANLNPATNQDPTSMNMRLWARDNQAGHERQIKHVLGLDASGASHFSHSFRPYYKFTQKTDIFIDGTTVGKAADISAGFDLILQDNSVI